MSWEQPLKHPSPNAQALEAFAGSQMARRVSQPEKARSPTEPTASGKHTNARDVQSRNAPGPMDASVVGKSTAVTPAQPQKTAAPIAVTELGMRKTVAALSSSSCLALSAAASRLFCVLVLRCGLLGLVPVSRLQCRRLLRVLAPQLIRVLAARNPSAPAERT